MHVHRFNNETIYFTEQKNNPWRQLANERKCWLRKLLYIHGTYFNEFQGVSIPFQPCKCIFDLNKRRKEVRSRGTLISDDSYLHYFSDKIQRTVKLTIEHR